jgi:hypothetical protein
MDFGFDYIWTIEATLALAQARGPADALDVRDIIAQEGMRRAADGMLFVTLIGVFLAFFQLLIAGVTAWGLVRSLQMTSRALEHSHANVLLGRATLQETRASANMGLRAYLALGSLTSKIIEEDERFVVELAQKFSNYGASATAELYPYGEIFLIKKPPSTVQAIHLAPRLKPWRQIMPGQELTHTTRLSGLNKNAMEMIRRGKWCVVHVFRIRYINPSGVAAGAQLGRDTVHWGEDLANARPLKGPDEEDQTIADSPAERKLS